MAGCAVIGGGLSGLSTAYLLSRLPRSQVNHVYVYEANPKRFGGCFKTGYNPKTGALHDLGPHSARISSPLTNPLLRLISSLGFTRDEVFWLPQLRRFIFVAGALRSIDLLSPTTQAPFTRSHLSMFVRRSLAKGIGPLKEDVSVDEFLRSRFDDEFAKYIGGALIRGICGVDSKRVSASALLSPLIRWENSGPNIILGAAKSIASEKLRSLLPSSQKGISDQAVDSLLPPLSDGVTPPPRASILNLKGGMQALTDRLIKTLSESPNVTLKRGALVKTLNYQGKQYELTLLDEGSSHLSKVKNDAVFLCTPARGMGMILSSNSFLPSSVTNLLTPEVSPAASVGVVALEFDIPHLALPCGFGHLLPISEDETVMGVVYDSCTFPHMDGKVPCDQMRRTVRFTIMLAPRPAWLKAAPASDPFDLEPELRHTLIEIGLTALKQQLGLQVSQPISAHVGLWNSSIPSYPVGHLDNVQRIRSAVANTLGPNQMDTLQLVGSALDGIGVGDCVKSAVKAVNTFSHKLPVR
ncbi:unnamed protein product [Mesocestoides corti]|uniref:Protoporphyrinogen oxidase n=1 Tax=Mesocestoides corti TaxID=53468 RepID=A0A0R3UQY6_MESCO|nr:unnamed protein product [Mesocestoides corti]